MLRPLQACGYPGCSARVLRGRCAAHAVAHEHTRPNLQVRKWYHTERWQRLRRAVLVDFNYACASCGDVKSELDVDHKVPHRGSPALFWDRSNLQALCAQCHGEKTKRGE